MSHTNAGQVYINCSDEESDVEDLSAGVAPPPSVEERRALRRSHRQKWQQMKRRQNKKPRLAESTQCEFEQISDSSDNSGELRPSVSPVDPHPTVSSASPHLTIWEIRSSAQRQLAEAFVENMPDQISLHPIDAKNLPATECIQVLLDRQNDVIRSFRIVEQKLDAIYRFLQSGISEVPANIDSEDLESALIKKVASSNPDIQRKTDYMKCLNMLGFPVTSSFEDLKQANAILDGKDNDAKLKRTALTNSLKLLIQDITSGTKTILGVVRMCMYAIAPARLWQFFSSQGKSGTTRYNLVKEMPNIYKAVVSAVGSCCDLDDITIRSIISDVVRSCQTRAESIKYRIEHPKLFEDLGLRKTSEQRKRPSPQSWSD